jgi:ribose transport system permease protein
MPDKLSRLTAAPAQPRIRLRSGQETQDLFAKYGAVAMLIVILAFNSLITPNFFAVGTIWNIVIQSSTIVLTGMGMTMVIASNGIDISIGSVMAIASMVAAKSLPLGVFPAIVAGLAAAAGVGLFTGFIVAKFKIQPIIVTLTVMIAGRGVAQVINDAMLLNFNNPGFSALGTGRLFGVLPIQLFLVAGVVCIVYFIMQRTTLGQYIQSVGDNLSAARLAGVRTVRTFILVYVMSAVLAGLAGLIETARLSAADGNSIGKLSELDAIAAVAVGGTSMTGGRARIIGTVIGAVIMQLITITVNMNNVPYEYAQVIKSIIIIVAVWFQRDRKV